MSGTQNLLIATMNGYKWIFPSSTNTFHGIFWGKHIHSWLDNAGLQMFSSFYCLTMWQYKSHFCQYLQSLFRCDSDIGLILTASNIFPAQSEPVHWQHPVSSHSVPLAAEPGILSVCPGDEGNFSGHFCVVDPPAVLKVLPLSFSAGLLEVTLALHCFNNPILSQQPANVEDMCE